MSSSSLECTKYILLRKTPFQESGWIISGISPQFGRIDFLSKGTRAFGKKKFPIIGIFREYAATFRFPQKQDGQLAYLTSLELVALHDSIANDLKSYLYACKLATFLLHNIPPMCEIPMIWDAFSSALVRIEKQNDPPRLCAALFLLVYAQEQGILPYDLFDESLTFKLLFACALNPNQIFPNVPPSRLDCFYNWADEVISCH